MNILNLIEPTTSEAVSTPIFISAEILAAAKTPVVISLIIDDDGVNNGVLPEDADIQIQRKNYYGSYSTVSAIGADYIGLQEYEVRVPGWYRLLKRPSTDAYGADVIGMPVSGTGGVATQPAEPPPPAPETAAA